jgi:hypothetical protein
MMMSMPMAEYWREMLSKMGRSFSFQLVSQQRLVSREIFPFGEIFKNENPIQVGRCPLTYRLIFTLPATGIH